MDMNSKEYDAVDNAIRQYTATGNITEKCPRCGQKLKYIEIGTSYGIECETKNCIAEYFRGI